MQYLAVTRPVAVTVDDFKRAVHIELDDVDDDVLLESYIEAATEVVETGTRRILLSQPVEFTVQDVGWLRWWVPVAPVSSVDQISYVDEGGNWVDADITGVRIVSKNDEPQIVIPETLRDAMSETDEIRIKVTAGSNSGRFPKGLKYAIILIVKDWFEAGISVEETNYLRVSFGCRAMIKQNRYQRPAIISAF